MYRPQDVMNALFGWCLVIVRSSSLPFSMVLIDYPWRQVGYSEVSEKFEVLNPAIPFAHSHIHRVLLRNMICIKQQSQEMGTPYEIR